MGVPLELVRVKILGAWPVFARPYNAREEVYKSEEPADQAEARAISGYKSRIGGKRNHRKRTQETGVGDAGKDLDSSPPDGNDPGGRGGVTGAGDKVGVVVRADQAEDEDTDDVEQEDTDPDTTNGFGNVLGRVAGFGGGHAQDLCPQEGVGSADQDGPETGETTQRSWDTLVLCESTRVVLHKPSFVLLSQARCRDGAKLTQ